MVKEGGDIKVTYHHTGRGVTGEITKVSGMGVGHHKDGNERAGGVWTEGPGQRPVEKMTPGGV